MRRGAAAQGSSPARAMERAPGVVAVSWAPGLLGSPPGPPTATTLSCVACCWSLLMLLLLVVVAAVVVFTPPFQHPPLTLPPSPPSPPFPPLPSHQQVIDVSHPGKAAVSKDDIAAHIAKLHKVDVKLVTVYGFGSKFGGGSSTGFGLIYDDEASLKKFEPKYRLIRKSLATKKTRTRKQWKDLKRKVRTTWGTGRRAAARAAKKAAAS
jgi:small subunit ribosomal protein S24e